MTLLKSRNRIDQEASFELARRHLADYGSAMRSNYQRPKHVEFICRKLELVEAGKIKRLMIFVPPRHSKSFNTSELFPAWYLGRNPTKYIIHATYGQTLSDTFGRKIKNQIEDENYSKIFPKVELSTDSRAADRFSLKSGAEYLAVGVGGALTGRGAHLLLIDDPIKNQEEAESKTTREKLKDWYRSVAYTRLMPGGAIIIIQTRWHCDDLSGWLLREHADENFEVISLPAIAINDDIIGRMPGEALWPDWYSVDFLEKTKRQLGSRAWSALYQQTPMLDDGGIIKKSWFNDTRYKNLPPFSRKIQSWDTANKAKELNDYCVCTTWGETRNAWYLIDVFRKRLEYPDLKHAAINCAAKYNPSIVLIEDKASGQSLIQDLRRNTRIPVIAIEPHKDKVIRMSSVSPLMETGKVWLPESASWLIDYEHELSTFPVGANDDQVDSTSQALNYLKDSQVSFNAVVGNELETNSMFARY